MTAHAMIPASASVPANQRWYAFLSIGRLPTNLPVCPFMANRYFSIDLDDGVKVNYAKFQGVELVTDSGTKVKKDLLVPIK